MDRVGHWDGVYESTPEQQVSWFQPEPAMSLRLLDEAGLSANRVVIDIGGGESLLVDRLLERGVRRIFVLDVSRRAIGQTSERLGSRAGRVAWIQADVTGDWAVPAVDLWHDRAVFHFLVDAGDRRRYIAHLRKAVKKGGSAILATFALDGPERCSGLPVARYSAETLAAEIGDGFQLVSSAAEAHTTPRGAIQRFCWTRFTRR